MSKTKNIETVTRIYEAFGKGDVPAILEHIAADVAWEYAYATDHEIPWLKHARGRDGVVSFLTTVASMLAFSRFEPKAILASDDGAIVVALCDLECTVQTTGKKIVEQHEPHLWHFDAQGRVTRFRHAADTLQHAKALR